MKTPRLRKILLALGILAVLIVSASPWIVASYWRARSDNPIRRGVARAQELGCFTCHGELGRRGIPIPRSDEGVPQWDGSVWMMYVKSDDDIRRYIVEGSPEKSEPSGHNDEAGQHSHDHDSVAISMPAYGDVVSDRDLDDLVATFKVLAGMVAPKRGTPAREGYDLARQWRCFSCHGPAGSGGLPNPGSFTGFVPGWYGADFRDLVRDRGEFDAWIREGSIPRLSGHLIASFFLERQLLPMPAYEEMTTEQLDSLWAYTQWLAETDGGHRGKIASW
jgi:mono/diheme cytochrome c family protein